MKKYKTIGVNELPKYSYTRPWCERILGLSKFDNVSRNLAKIKSEYDADKYKECLEFYEKLSPKPSVEKVREFFDRGFDPKICVSVGHDLVIVSPKLAMSLGRELMFKTLLPEITDGDAVIELGSGFGYNLHILKKKAKKNCEWIGGEYSKNAVDLGNKLAADSKSGVKLEIFDFYDPIYKVLDDIDRPMVIFTFHATEQVPNIDNLVKALRKYKKSIKAVVHFEPLFESQDDSLLGLMRRRYAELNDYNRNLQSVLKNAADVDIKILKPNVFGLMPFNPSSVVKWRFRNN